MFRIRELDSSDRLRVELNEKKSYLVLHKKYGDVYINLPKLSLPRLQIIQEVGKGAFPGHSTVTLELDDKLYDYFLYGSDKWEAAFYIVRTKKRGKETFGFSFLWRSGGYRDIFYCHGDIDPFNLYLLHDIGYMKTCVVNVPMMKIDLPYDIYNLIRPMVEAQRSHPSIFESNKRHQGEYYWCYRYDYHKEIIPRFDVWTSNKWFYDRFITKFKECLVDIIPGTSGHVGMRNLECDRGLIVYRESPSSSRLASFEAISTKYYGGEGEILDRTIYFGQSYRYHKVRIHIRSDTLSVLVQRVKKRYVKTLLKQKICGTLVPKATDWGGLVSCLSTNKYLLPIIHIIKKLYLLLLTGSVVSEKDLE